MIRSGEPLTSVVYLPVPDRATLCGLPGALSVNSSEPVRTPASVGVKVTFTSQEAPAATVPPATQGVTFFVSLTVAKAKSPLVAMLLMFSVPVPLLVSVTAFAAA